MNNLFRNSSGRCPSSPVPFYRLVLNLAWLAVAAATLSGLSGCGPSTPSATVEGVLRLHGKPLDHCLVLFLPESQQGAKVRRSTSVTDQNGCYRLRFDDLTEGAAVGMHRVVVQDMLISTGVQRRDNGTVDACMDEERPATPTSVRRSRIPEAFTTQAKTPLRKEVKPDHQVIDLEIQ